MHLNKCYERFNIVTQNHFVLRRFAVRTAAPALPHCFWEVGTPLNHNQQARERKGDNTLRNS